MAKYHAPLDPECPEAKRFLTTLFDDPMSTVSGAPLDEIVDEFERRHVPKCKRCQEFGLANIEIKD